MKGFNLKSMFTHTKLLQLVSLDHQINHCLAVQLIMIAIELHIGMDARAVVLGVFVGEFGHLKLENENQSEWRN
jgi:hypothetical protein